MCQPCSKQGVWRVGTGAGGGGGIFIYRERRRERKRERGDGERRENISPVFDLVQGTRRRSWSILLDISATIKKCRWKC